MSCDAECSYRDINIIKHHQTNSNSFPLYSSVSNNVFWCFQINFANSEFYGFSEFYYSMEDVLRMAGKYDYMKFSRAAKVCIVVVKIATI